MSDERGRQPPAEGTRERKRRETRGRIADAALRLFLEDGYDATTVDAIAEAAGISRRTFFAYFASKDEVVAAWQAAAWDAVLADLLAVSPDENPLDAVRAVLVAHASLYESEQMRAIDGLMHASESLAARKPASYAMQERSLYETLCEVWRQPERRAGLRVVAMVSIGAMRLAIEAYGASSGRRSVANFLDAAFSDLKAELAPPSSSA
jgi:AcrR family transcriptional regulator